MTSIGSQLGLGVLMLAAAFLGPALAIGLLLARKRRVRAARSSPIGIDLLRGPGHTLKAEAEDLQLDAMGYLLGLAVLPLLLLALHLAQSYVLGIPENAFRTTFLSALGLVCVGVLLRNLVTRVSRLDNLRLGYDAEVAVGQELDQLMRQGAFVFHDFPADRFNIDHIVIAPQGVFAVETKGYSKRNDLKGSERARVEFDGKQLRFPAWTSSEALEQAERQAKWLAAWLSRATGGPIGVTPVLALPGWYVERKGRGGVQVFSGRELVRLLDARPNRPLTAAEVQQVVHQVDQRCRNVKPSYQSGDK